ncbi:MAG: histidine phosphatase family protein [FCB group bacterium]|nr:histidine phosphatase family protein [FCB group bacterium]MBL7029236.1 histidine phosphatase family protein [Candidatus Neomarinimicrobiota bacterium]MBL7123219.1 histidine phosphatase family protein [Candidatus Neomarinimicrobiota bacterium]
MSKIYLIRHGQTEWNSVGRIQGFADTPINDMGRTQIELLSSYLSQIPNFHFRLISSDAKRCKESTEVLSGVFGTPFIAMEELREVNFGVWNGRKISELKKDVRLKKVWNNLSPNHVWEGGESFTEAHSRANNCIEECLQESNVNNLVVVTHGIIIQLLMSYWIRGSLAYSKDFVVENGSVTIVDRSEDGIVNVIAINLIPEM